jgi:2-(1,2-epoxy-1,2-dihydrophenyl)acetyl-CoA isomerase
MRSDAVVLTEREGSLAILTLNRPSSLNAVGPEMAQALCDALAQCAADDEIRVVILTGTGRAFCAGGDMKAAWEALRSGQDPRGMFGLVTSLMHRAVLDLRQLPKPVVAAVNGAASGIGVSLAAACDLRVAGEGARFKVAYTSIGLSPDGGWTVLVPHLVGFSRATELLMLDPLLEAGRALSLGLVHEVVSDAAVLERAKELANQLVRMPATSLAAAKALLNAALLPALEGQLERERQAVLAQCASADFHHRLAAFLQR